MADFTSACMYVADPGLFLNLVTTKLRWGDLAGDILFDVGCGNPTIKMADLLVERFPDLQRVICIDNKAKLIKFNKFKNLNRLIEHRCMDIEKRSDVSRFEGLVDKVLSTNTWQMLQDQAGAFGNVFFILRPGGEAAFLFCIWTGYADWFAELTQNSRWNEYFNGRSPLIPVTQYVCNLDKEYYTRLLKAQGFEVVYCEKDRIRIPFPSDQQCKERILRMISCSFSVPSDLEDEFKSFIFEIYMKHYKRDEEGRPCQISYYVTAIVKKPRE